VSGTTPPTAKNSSKNQSTPSPSPLPPFPLYPFPSPVSSASYTNAFRTNVSRFVQFVNLLLNDVTYLLDEGLSKLTEINKLQKELDRPTTPSDDPTSTAPREREDLLAQTERQATSYISLSNETVSLLTKFTAFVPDSFVYPEVVDRLARMLNFNQNLLTGDKCKNLKVKDPARYRFNPKDLLSEIVDIYLNLAGQKAFVTACARDGRSYRREVFEKTCGILRKYSLKSARDVAAFERFGDEVEVVKQADEEGEADLGEVPEHFLGMYPYTLRCPGGGSECALLGMVLTGRSVDVYDYGGSCYFADEQNLY